MESLFSRLFKYRSSDKRIQQENFLTEIFAFLLKNPGLMAAFLNECGVTIQGQPENIEVKPQFSLSTYPEKIQPDISLEFIADNQKWLVFIENKVGAGEGEGQLKKYASYLEKEANEDTNCALLYITRFNDPKPSPSTKIIFGQKRWWEIHEMLDKFTGNPFVSQARLFMEENNLSLSKSFSANHITAMMYWNETKEMMDRSLGDVVEEKFKEITQRKYSAHWINKNLRDYGDYFQAIGNSLWFGIGYFLASSGDKNNPSVGGAIVVEPSYSKRPQAIQALREFSGKKNNWELSSNFDNEEEAIWITRGQSFKEFIGLDNHINAIQKLFLDILSDLAEFQKAYPQLKWD